MLGPQVDPRDWMRSEVQDLSTAPPNNGEFWFDYIADSGDGETATYSIAYLCLSDLWLRGSTCSFADPGGAALLPRGAFLFVGGDTTYHVADYNTLVERFQGPFNWAAEDKWGANHEGEKRPIFAIPGNHDYYDFLNGFGRQFRKPFDPGWLWPRFQRGPQLELKAFSRVQETSFVALKLPFDWWLWGLDIEGGKIDGRQFHFFRTLRDQERIRKLIVATPEPTTVFGRLESATSEIARTFQDLVLPRVFLDNGEEVPEGCCRLDIAGDVHHYTRYWGVGADDPGPQRINYASVVSGMGGAFVHPTYTDFGEVRPNRIYPAKEVAQRVVLARTLNPLKVATSGMVWLFAGLIAMVLYFGAIVQPSTRSFVKQLGVPLPEIWRYGPSPNEGVLPKIEDALSTDLAGKGWDNEILVVVLYLSAVWLAGWGTNYLCRRAIDNKQTTRAFWGFALPAVFLVVFCFYLVDHDDSYGTLHPMLASVVVAAFLATSAACLHWTGQYTDALTDMTRIGRKTSISDSLPWLLLVFTAIGGAAIGIWRYGEYHLAVVSADLTYLLVVLLIVFGLPGLAGYIGGSKSRGWGKVGFIVLGIWHALVQAILPFTLAAYVSYWVGIGALAATMLGTYAVGRLVGLFLHKGSWLTEGRRLAWVMTSAWITLAAAMWIGLQPFLVYSEPATVGRVVWAGFLGALFGCTWFGWYLVVASFFNGHNNEVGGAARIEEFKQIIRFRLTANELTGHVIAIDQPEKDGALLRPRIVDVFTVKCQ